MLCLIALMSIGGVFTVASASVRPWLKSDANCTTVKTDDSGWRVSCNITVASNDLIIEIKYDSFFVQCNEMDTSNSLKKKFPNILIQSVLDKMKITNCSWSHADIISRIRTKNRSEDGSTLFGRDASLILINNNYPLIKSGYFSSLPNLKHLHIKDCCIQFDTRAFYGLNNLDTLILRGSNVSLPSNILDDVRNLTTFCYQYNAISSIPENLFSYNKLLKNVSITYNTELNSLPQNLFTNLTNMLHLYLNNNGLKELQSNLFRNCTGLNMIDLSNNSLDSLPEDVFKDVTGLNELRLSHNLIAELPRNLFLNQSQLKTLDLSYNRLHNIEPALQVVLTHNILRELHMNCNHLDVSIQLIKLIQANEGSLQHFSIEGNKLRCDCNTLSDLLHITLDLKLVNVGSLSCENGHSFSGESIELICPHSGYYYTIVVVVLVFTAMLLLLTAIALYYKYKTEVKVFMYARGWCLGWLIEVEQEENKKFDLFIAFSHKDDSFVTKVLVPKLEGPPYHYRVCLHYRDWVQGEAIAKQIVESIENSKRTIIVLSPNFLDSEWCKFELRVAHYNTLKERRIRLIALKYKKLDNSEEVDEELNAYLRTITCVKWGDAWFWEKLFYAMPHSSSNNTPKPRADIIKLI